MTKPCGLFFTSYRAEAALFPSRCQRAWMTAFVLALLACPWVLGSYALSVVTLVLLAVMGAVSLNLLTGVCGQISLGHGAFVGVGAYGAAVVANAGFPFPVALLGGGIVAAMVGMVFGIPSLRLKGIYLAISTLAAQIVLEYLFLHLSSVTGGSNGLGVSAPVLWGSALDTECEMYYLVLVVTTLCVLGASNIMRTRPGRAFVAIRDYYQAAENVGVNLFAMKLQAFGISAFLAGIAGGLWAFYTQYITPEQFSMGLSISYLAMIIIGGLGSVLGSIFGAVFLTLLPEGLNLLVGILGTAIPNFSQLLLPLKEGIFGLMLVVFLVFEPEGLVRMWRLTKAYWKLYPFAY